MDTCRRQQGERREKGRKMIFSFNYFGNFEPIPPPPVQKTLTPF
jgi:hypothetical protein